MLEKFLKIIVLGKRASSDSYIKHLKKKGMKIGKGTVIYVPRTTTIDETRPWLIKIGDNVKITTGVTILTHGFDWSVLKTKFGDILGSSGKVFIGNNVFIGANSTILKGCKIGNNVIIGANTLVNKDIPDNVVVASNPARIICNINDYYKKRQKEQLKEATELTIEYYKTYNKWPDKKVLREFIFLFEKRTHNKKILEEVFNEIAAINNIINTNGKFNSYEDFINYCKEDLKNKGSMKNEKI